MAVDKDWENISKLFFKGKDGKEYGFYRWGGNLNDGTKADIDSPGQVFLAKSIKDMYKALKGKEKSNYVKDVMDSGGLEGFAKQGSGGKDPRTRKKYNPSDFTTLDGKPAPKIDPKDIAKRQKEIADSKKANLESAKKRMADATSTPEGLAKRKSAMQETKDKLAAQKAGTWKAGDPWPPKKTTEKKPEVKDMSPRPSMSAREKQVAAYKASKKKTAAAKQARADRERAANPFDPSNSTKIGKHSGLGDLYKSKDGKTLFTKKDGKRKNFVSGNDKVAQFEQAMSKSSSFTADKNYKYEAPQQTINDVRRKVEQPKTPGQIAAGANLSRKEAGALAEQQQQQQQQPQSALANMRDTVQGSQHPSGPDGNYGAPIGPGGLLAKGPKPQPSANVTKPPAQGDALPGGNEPNFLGGGGVLPPPVAKPDVNVKPPVAGGPVQYPVDASGGGNGLPVEGGNGDMVFPGGQGGDQSQGPNVGNFFSPDMSGGNVDTGGLGSGGGQGGGAMNFFGPGGGSGGYAGASGPDNESWWNPVSGLPSGGGGYMGRRVPFGKAEWQMDSNADANYTGPRSILEWVMDEYNRTTNEAKAANEARRDEIYDDYGNLISRSDADRDEIAKQYGALRSGADQRGESDIDRSLAGFDAARQGVEQRGQGRAQDVLGRFQEGTQALGNIGQANVGQLGELAGQARQGVTGRFDPRADALGKGFAGLGQSAEGQIGANTQALQQGHSSRANDMTGAFGSGRQSLGNLFGQAGGSLKGMYGEGRQQVGQDYGGAIKGASGRYGGRLQKGMELLQGLGAGAAADIGERHDESLKSGLAGVQSQAQQRGLGNTTISGSMQQGLKSRLGKDRESALGKLRDSLIDRQAGMFSQLSGDQQRAIDSFTQGGLGARTQMLGSGLEAQRQNLGRGVDAQRGLLDKELTSRERMGGEQLSALERGQRAGEQARQSIGLAGLGAQQRGDLARLDADRALTSQGFGAQSDALGRSQQQIGNMMGQGLGQYGSMQQQLGAADANMTGRQADALTNFLGQNTARDTALGQAGIGAFERGNQETRDRQKQFDDFKERITETYPSLSEMMALLKDWGTAGGGVNPLGMFGGGGMGGGGGGFPGGGGGGGGFPWPGGGGGDGEGDGEDEEEDDGGGDEGGGGDKPPVDKPPVDKPPIEKPIPPVPTPDPPIDIPPPGPGDNPMPPLPPLTNPGNPNDVPPDTGPYGPDPNNWPTDYPGPPGYPNPNYNPNPVPPTVPPTVPPEEGEEEEEDDRTDEEIAEEENLGNDEGGWPPEWTEEEIEDAKRRYGPDITYEEYQERILGNSPMGANQA